VQTKKAYGGKKKSAQRCQNVHGIGQRGLPGFGVREVPESTYKKNQAGMKKPLRAGRVLSRKTPLHSLSNPSPTCRMRKKKKGVEKEERIKEKK